MSEVGDTSADVNLFEQGPVVRLVWKHVPGRPVEYVSANCLQVLGYSRDELISPGFSFAALIHPEDIGRLQDEQSQNSTAGRDSCELSYRFKTKHKGYRWFYDYTQLVYDDEGQASAIQGYLFDQTQLKRTEEALATERERLARIIESTNAGTWEWDIETDSVTVNERWALQLGHKLSELVALDFKAWRQFVHPEDIKRKEQLLERLFSKEQEHYQIEYRLHHKDGHWVWIQARGKVSVWAADNRPLQVSATHTDISTRKQTEEQLQQKTAMLENVLSSLTYPFMLIDVNDYTIAMANGYAMQNQFIVLGKSKCYESSHQESSPCSSLEHPCPIGRVRETLSPVILEHIHVDPLGNHINVEVHAFPLLNEKGCLTHIIEYVIDVTDRKQAEQELLSAKDQAETASKAKGQFLANMSHEIRTPMNGIIGVLQLMQMTKLTEEQRELLDIAKSASDTLTAVIGDILEYSRIEAGGADLQVSNFSISQLLRDIERLFHLPAQDKGLELTSSIYEDVPDNLLGDGFRLRQVLSNLIGNAVKFTQDGGVDVRVKLKHRSARKVELQVEVADTGPGIPSDQIRGLFERFSQADSSHTRRYGGVGLGLAIAKGIVELMSGEIWVESEVGVGSTFYFTCVVETGSYPSVEIFAERNEATCSNDAHILVVEDDLVSRLMVQKLLQKNGWRVSTAINGKDALEVFSKHSFDLILMDVQMPEMDGYTATARIREVEKGRGTHTPIIAMTAHAMQQDRAESLRAGMDEYMAKPISRENLYSRVECFLSKA